MRLKIFLFAIVAALATVFAADWTGSAVEPENMKKIDGKAFYVITSAEELAWFANQVNSGKTTINAVLNNDIVFGANTSTTCSKAWTPIGKDSSHIFNGIFDGGHHTIYGLYINDAVFAGLIGIMGSNGIVKNMTLTVGNIKSTKTSNYIGGFVAINSGKVDSVVNKNSISTSGQNGAGIVGWNASSALISNARNEATLSFNGTGGGVASKNDGSILNSVNKGNISISVSGTCYASNVTYTYYLGGIAGENNGSLAYVTNEGMISATSAAKACQVNSRKWASTTVNTYQGGIAGINRTNAKSSKSSNSGTLTYSGKGDMSGYTLGGGALSNGIVGGIAGRNEGQVDNSCNFDSRNIVGETSGKIINSFSVGNSTYWANNVSRAYTTENMKKDQFAWVLNTTDGTTSNSGIWSRNEGYPIFANNSYKAIYKVVFDDEGTSSNRYTNYKGLVTFPENPDAPEGLIFSGWYNADGIKVKPPTVFTIDQTVNAIYVDASDVFWTINFYNAAPADTVLESKSYQHGSIVTYGGVAPTLASTAQYTYTFKGWDVEPTNAVEDFDYHAVYDSTVRSYTITFNNTDGSEIENATFEYGKMPSCTKTPTREATVEWKYSHKGWKPALDYVTEAATYMAIYDSSKVEYKVTFLNGTTVIDEQMVPYGDAAVAPTNVTREGYKFVGWNTSFAAVTGALTVKALFEELIIRTVNVVGDDGDKIVDATVEDGGKYILPEAPKKEGYTFDAYYDGDKKLGIAGDEVSVTANITIIARYILRSYVITFNNYDGSKIESASFEYGKMPSCTKTPTRAATAEWTYSHKGWKPALNYVSEDAIYTAIYDSSKVKYKVTFVDGTTVIDEQMVPYGGAAVAPTNVTREGYKFVGWNASFTEVTEALTVMALFEKLIFRTVWVLDGFGGTIEKVKVEDGGKYTLPEAPKKDGYIDDYVFDAYYSENKKLGVAGDVISVTANITITAKYIANPKSSSSQQEIATSSSSSRNDKSSSSSSRINSSSSAKTEAIVATVVPKFSVMVNGRSLQISAARIGAAYALFDMQGKVLLQGRVQAANFEIPVMRAGSYLLKIESTTQRVSVR